MFNLLVNTRRPDVSFNRNGKIRLTARVVRMLSMSPGDSINIAVNDGEYLLHSTPHDADETLRRFEAKCYPSKRGGGKHYCANSVRLCRSLLSSIGCTADKVSFIVGDAIEMNGKIYLPIITQYQL